jgi:cytochrome bd-type quinol oxidase subunit 2
MARQALIILAVVIAFGVLVPIYKGFGFLDARILAAYALLAILFVAPASAELGASESQARISSLLGKIAIIIAWGWGITVLILGTAIVTLNVPSRRGGFLSPPLIFLAAILVFGLTASSAVAMLAAALARRFSAVQVKNILRAAFLFVLLAAVFGPRVLPESVTLTIFDRIGTRSALTHLAWEASAVCAVVTAVVLLTILKTRPRAPFANIRMAENPPEGGR